MLTNKQKKMIKSLILSVYFPKYKNKLVTVIWIKK